MEKGGKGGKRVGKGLFPLFQNSSLRFDIIFTALDQLYFGKKGSGEENGNFH